jgi:DNA-directed RNA polymerase subunit RPC12/RpoP
METITSSILICPQCGGENQIPADEKFFECEYCGSAVYVDKRKIVNHFVVNSNFSKEQAEGNLRRWMAGNFQVKDLDKLSNITQVYFYYFPLWYFKTKDSSGDKVHLQPAHSTSVSEIKQINIPAGNLKVFHKKDYNEKDFVTPDVLYESAKSWLEQSGVNTESMIESNLVHIPFYQFYYEFKGNQYTAIVEASSGKVYANIWPAKSETPFRILFGISILVFLFISFISGIIAFMINDDYEIAFITYEMIKFAGYIAASVPLVIIAYFVAKKV